MPCVTVTEHEALFPLPSAAATVMVALPVLMAVTFPLASTVAMLVSLLSQFTFLLVALSGSTVTVRVSLPVSCKVRLVLSSFTPVTGITTGLSMLKVNSLLSKP